MLWVIEAVIITLSDIWWYCWQNWVSFCVSLPLGTVFTYTISLLPCWYCSLPQVALFLPQNSKPGSQEEGQGFESWRALLGGTGQSFPDLWFCVEWVAAVMLRLYWGFFIVGFFPPYTISLPAPKKHSRVAGCPVMACFPAELSSAAATCWKPLLVLEDVCLRQQQSNFLADKCS